MNKRHSTLSFVLTLFIVSLLFLSGPAAAVTVSLTSPNNADQGNDVSFTLTVDINDPDTYVPIKYTNIVLNGPNGFSKVCKVNMDGTSDCSDVDVSVINNVGSGVGTGYGYDSRIGYGYDLGTGFGYGYAGAYGAITYDIVWHTTSDLEAGTYTAKADVITGSHDFSSSEQTFSITSPSTTYTDNNPSSGPGPRGAPYPEAFEAEAEEESALPLVTETTTEEGGNEVTGEATAGDEITGAVVGGESTGVGKMILFVIGTIVLIVAISYFYNNRKGLKMRANLMFL